MPGNIHWYIPPLGEVDGRYILGLRGVRIFAPKNWIRWRGLLMR